MPVSAQSAEQVLLPQRVIVLYVIKPSTRGLSTKKPPLTVPRSLRSFSTIRVTPSRIASDARSLTSGMIAPARCPQRTQDRADGLGAGALWTPMGAGSVGG